MECPEKVTQDKNFTVSVTVHYRFAELTNLSLGLWDTVTKYPIIEKNMKASGEDTITPRLEATAPEEPGNYTLDAAAFYQYADEWFIDEEGIVRFWVVVEKPNPFLGGQAITVAVFLLVIIGYLYFRRLKPRIVRSQL